MITTRNTNEYDRGFGSIKDRAAHLVQALEGCPLEFILKTLAVFDSCNSPDAKKPSARRWVRHFAGFESESSSKAMEPIIELLNDGFQVTDGESLGELMKDMKDRV